MCVLYTDTHYTVGNMVPLCASAFAIVTVCICTSIHTDISVLEFMQRKIQMYMTLCVCVLICMPLCTNIHIYANKDQHTTSSELLILLNFLKIHS